MLRYLKMLSFTLIGFSLRAQSIFYGTADFGKVEFINDSVLTVSFISAYPYLCVDTCSYHTANDTIWMSTKARKRFSVSIHNEAQPDSGNDTNFVPFILKLYQKRTEKKQQTYHLVQELIVKYDMVNHRMVLNNWLQPDDNMIIVIKDFICYVRFKWKRIEGSFQFATIDEHIEVKVHVFDEFPLLIKGNKLIPVNKEKQEECWIDNGFHFPKMKLSAKRKRYETIGYWYRGLCGLPSGFDLP